MSTRLLLLGGVLGAVLFVLVFTALGATRAQYDTVRHFISILSLGPGGWAQIANFIVGGVLIVGLGVGLGRRWRDGPGARWVPRAIALTGVGLIWCGVFIPDPSLGYPPGTPDEMITPLTWHGALHYAGATAILVALSAAVLLSIRRGLVLRQPGLTLASAGVAIVVVGGCALAILFAPGDPTRMVGLLERIGVYGGWAWLVAVGCRELRSAEQCPD